MKIIASTFFVATLLATPAAAQERPVVIHAGVLVAQPGQPPLRDQTIVVRDGRVVEIRAGAVAASTFGPDARLVDLSHAFVLPGLTDLHYHLTGNLGPDRRQPSTPAVTTLRAARQARLLLEAGVTTVRDLGDQAGTVSFDLRDVFARGDLPGPRVFAAGPIIAPTGGHGRRYCDGAASCREAVRRNVSEGADLIKAGNSGSASEELGQADAPASFFPDEINDLVATAKRLHRRVAVHAHSAAGINDALRAGATTIEHGTYFDDESVRLFKQTGAYLVPTDWIGEFMLTSDVIRQTNTPADWKRIQQIGGLQKQLSGRAWRAGVKLGVGTDAMPGADPQATIREIEIFQENGVPAQEALKAATVNAADILGQGGDLGRIAVGYRADIIAVRDDPTVSVSALRRVDFVMKDGRVYKQESGR